MRYIRKGQPPAELVAYCRDAADPTYKDAPKAALRDALWAEQHGLCAYCTGPLRASSTRIEHWAPQSAAPARQLDYRNLLLCCDGNEACRQAAQTHCDVRKGSAPIALNPTQPEVERQVTFGRKGVRAIGLTPEIQQEIDAVLGLNVDALTVRRRALVHGLNQRISRRFPKKQPSKVWLERQVQRLEAEPRPFGRALLAYLLHRLDRLR